MILFMSSSEIHTLLLRELTHYNEKQEAIARDLGEDGDGEERACGLEDAARILVFGCDGVTALSLL